ncbi:MAG TPA: zf-TFIIB domain-containing protein [Gemmatimonadaceae bacterium]|nr:zf-TFIIB domain-containing protein [Gemmatimonadaceae bacterium]
MWEPGKPSQNENEYFARRDAEWLKEQRAALDRERAARAAGHQGLKCPRCDGQLVVRDVQHVKIDVCEKCRGTWLDAGELEMVLHLPRAELLAAVHALDARPR